LLLRAGLLGGYDGVVGKGWAGMFEGGLWREMGC
jgi:hypothetical protein